MVILWAETISRHVDDLLGHFAADAALDMRLKLKELIVRSYRASLTLSCI